MFNHAKMVAGALIVLPFALGAGVIIGIKHQKSVVAAQVSENKIVILQEGKKVDEKVFDADDNGLCLLLGGC